MPTIITIDRSDFLLKSDSSLPAVLKALSGAIKLDWDYHREGHERHYVRRRPIVVQIKLVDASMIHDVETPEIVEEPTPAPAPQKRLNGRQTLLLGNP